MGAEPPARLLVNTAAGDEELLRIAIEAARMAGGLLPSACGGRGGEVAQQEDPDRPRQRGRSRLSARDSRADRRTSAAGRFHRRGGPPGGGERSGLSWVVDPLDGTVNFLFGIPQWCVSVAVRDEQREARGSGYDPTREELFTATHSGVARPHRRGWGERRGPRGRSSFAPAGEPIARHGDDRHRPRLRRRRAGAQAARARPPDSPRPRHPPLRQRRARSAWTAAGRYDAYFERPSSSGTSPPGS